MTQTDASLKVRKYGQIFGSFDFTTLALRDVVHEVHDHRIVSRYATATDFVAVLSTKVNMSKIRCGERHFSLSC